MAITRDVQLIDAAEGGDAAHVRRLLADGANPNARKKVTLTVTKSGHLFARSETVLGESALALAVIYGHEDVVRALLSGGADHPATSTCEWRISNHCSPWTSDDWSKHRWIGTYSFPSTLSLALGGPGTLTWWNGGVGDATSSDGGLYINLKGGLVELEDPKTRSDTCIWARIRPSLAIVQLLLDHGAIVSDIEWDAARRHPDPLFSVALQPYYTETPKTSSRALSPGSSNESPITPQITETTLFASLLAENDRKIEETTAKLAELSIGATFADDGDSSNVSADIEKLKQQLSSLRSDRSSLLTTSAPEPAPPRTIEKLMHAVADFQARHKDELDIQSGEEVYVNLLYYDKWAS
ncbi:hypothetical protein HDU93_003120, partial [Gonapodya sp. JEL0774]